jgi:hypothetical protein
MLQSSYILPIVPVSRFCFSLIQEYGMSCRRHRVSLCCHGNDCRRRLAGMSHLHCQRRGETLTARLHGAKTQKTAIQDFTAVNPRI